MKKAITLLLITLLCASNLHAQRSASDIKYIITHDFERLLEKYDYDEACDSILVRVNGFLAEAEKRHQQSPTAADLCEAAVWHSFKASFLNGMLGKSQYPISSRTDI